MIGLRKMIHLQNNLRQKTDTRRNEISQTLMWRTPSEVLAMAKSEMLPKSKIIEEANTLPQYT